MTREVLERLAGKIDVELEGVGAVTVVPTEWLTMWRGCVIRFGRKLGGAFKTPAVSKWWVTVETPPATGAAPRQTSTYGSAQFVRGATLFRFEDRRLSRALAAARMFAADLARERRR